MFKHTFRAKVKKVEVFAKEIDDQVFRRIRLTLEREFDGEIAAGLGEAGRDTLELLRDGGLSKAVLPIDSITAKAVLKSAHGTVTCEPAVGMRATANGPKRSTNEDDEETEESMVQMVFVIPFNEEVWVFLGKNALDVVDVTLMKSQLSLDLPRAPTEPKANNGPKSGPAGGNGGGPKTLLEPPPGARGRQRGGAAPADPQTASTPEEAERIREQSLRQQRQDDDAVWDDEPAAATTSSSEQPRA